jgi:hypothetical protein
MHMHTKGGGSKRTACVKRISPSKRTVRSGKPTTAVGLTSGLARSILQAWTGIAVRSSLSAGIPWARMRNAHSCAFKLVGGDAPAVIRTGGRLCSHQQTGGPAGEVPHVATWINNSRIRYATCCSMAYGVGWLGVRGGLAVKYSAQLTRCV